VSSASTSTRTELSGASAVTFLVLLLQLGGVDSRSAEALGRATAWAKSGIVCEDVVRAPDREIRTERRHGPVAEGTEALRLTVHSVRVVRTIADAMLPRPRAPDRDQVL